MNLSNEQRRAVQLTGRNICVVAGPGSGKTRVLTERFAWLVEERAVNPGRILAITFTDKGALEIQQRLVKRFSGRREMRDAIERSWVSTIHGFCARLLRENAIAAGLAPDFAVLEAPEASRIEREAAEEALDELYSERPEETRRLIDSLDLSTQDDGRQPDLAGGLVAVYEKMRVAGVGAIPDRVSRRTVFDETLGVARELFAGRISNDSAPRLRDWLGAFLALPQTLSQEHFKVLSTFNVNLNKFRNAHATRLKKELLPALEQQWIGEWYTDLDAILKAALDRIGKVYQARKRSQSALDFSDLEEYTLQLLTTSPQVRRETTARFDHVLMDELQDTNPLQWKIVDLVRTNLFAVGDRNQSIYGFRNADPDLFLSFHDSADVAELHDNYRSRPQILTAVSRVFHETSGVEPRELIAKGEFRTVDDPIVERFAATDENAEAEFIAQRIRQWREAGTFQYHQVAVLFRTFAAAGPLQAAFHRFGIPCILSGGRNFMEARECLDILNLLAALVNPLDEIPLMGVLRGPLGGFSDSELSGSSRDAWRAWFEERFGSVRRYAGYLPPDLLLARALDQSGYTARLAPHERSNVDQLLTWLRTEFRNRPRPLAELLHDLEALRAAQNSPPAPPPEAGDVVRMMTIHAAKGLEFPVVFLCGLHRSTRQSSAPILFGADLGIGCKWRHPVKNEGVSDPAHSILKQRERIREDEEADRLLYVAMTRAENRLVLSYVEKKYASGWVKLAEAAVPALSPPAPPVMAEVRKTSPVTPAITGGAGKLRGQHDSAASVTSVALFAECPRRYYLARYLGLEPEVSGPGTGAIEVGLAVHSALAGGTVESAEATSLAERFRTSTLGQHATRATRIEHEFDFLFELEDIILRGQIDLWFEENGELILVDYKTDRAEATSSGYALQLRLYALALERYIGRLPDRAVLHYLRTDRIIDISLSPADLQNARDTVTQFRQAQDDLVFPLRVGIQCERCPFRTGLCPEGRGESTEEGLNSVPVSWKPSSSPEPARGGS